MSGINTAVTHLKNCQFLNSASDDIVSYFAERCNSLTIKAGETIFHRGDYGNAIYIITNGLMRIHEDGIILKKLSSGETFGEIGALTSESRTATVTAEVDSELLKIEQHDFYQGLIKYPATAKIIINALCEKERHIIEDETAYALKANQLENELEIAHDIQRSFLPLNVPAYEGWKFLPYLKPAKNVAGDFYDFFELPSKGYIGFVIGDVCDKGLSAALFMTLFRTLINSSAQLQDFCNPGENENYIKLLLNNCVSFTNRYISTTHEKDNMFASVFVGIINPLKGNITYINAGHEPPFIINRNKIKQAINPTGPIVGIFPEAKYSVQEISLEPGETFFAYTDGIPDAKNVHNEFFTEERLISTVTSAKNDAEALLSTIQENITQFVGDAEQYDDITMMIIERQ